MSEQSKEQLLGLNQSCQKLQNGMQSLLLSTMNSEGFPEISYAPYFSDQPGVFYIFISELARHTKNLSTSPRASVMFIADEGDSQNLFARERLTYRCSAEEVEPQKDEYKQVLNGMEDQFGNIMAMLKTLPDFHLFRLEAFEGSYVVGFGKAYEIDLCSGELIHLSEVNIRSKRN